MDRIRSIGLFLAVLLSTMPLPSQASVEGSEVFGNLSNAQLSAIAESRRLAFQELEQRSVAFEFPEIANALSFPSYLIAIAKITSADLPNPGHLRTTIIHFHVEQLLRGAPEITDFEVESHWAPKSPGEDIASDFSCDGQCPESLRVLDRTEPKVGDQYVLGYSFDYNSDKSDNKLTLAFALDMQDPAQSGLLGDIEHFLRIESEPSPSGFEAYLKELDSSISWVRDIAIRRLSESDSCNASPDCAKKFTAVVTGQLQSKIPNERLQALHWLVWVNSVSEAYRSGRKFTKACLSYWPIP